MTVKNHITLVGCGNMGGALLKGWLAAKIDAHYHVIDPQNKTDQFKNYSNLTFLQTPDDRLKSSQTIILAVKPQYMDQTCTDLKPFVQPQALIISIAAGRTIASFENIFGSLQPIVRCMPNLPASIGKGMTVGCANKTVTPEQKQWADALLRCAGKMEWVTNENLIHAVTATSGSGPAYVFLLIETLAKAGEAAGLSKDLATTLARQTIIGSAALVESNPDITAETLRKNVTSPNGTTEAALKILMNGEWESLFKKAIAAAKKRSEELG